jgi:hypothetical protein
MRCTAWRPDYIVAEIAANVGGRTTHSRFGDDVVIVRDASVDLPGHDFGRLGYKRHPYHLWYVPFVEHPYHSLGRQRHEWLKR